MKLSGVVLLGFLSALCMLLASCRGEGTVINFNFAGLIPANPGHCHHHGGSGNDDDGDHDDSESYDYVIVGGGPAGCLLARRLAEDGDATVLLLEAGHEATEEEDLLRLVPRFQFNDGAENPTFAHMTSTEDNEFTFNRRFQLYEGRSFGGGTNIYSGLHARPNLNDIEAWGWPGLNASEALEYYKKTESNPLGGPFHGTDGPLPIHIDEGEDASVGLQYLISSAANLGIPTPNDLENGYTSIGVGTVQRMMADGKRLSAYDALLPEQVRTALPNLELRSGAQVTKVLIDSSATARGVKYIHSGHTHKVKATREVILSAGVARSPQLLMLSGVGPSEALTQLSIEVKVDLPGVGQNYVERPRAQVVMASTLDEPAMDLELVYSEDSLGAWTETGTGPLTKGASGGKGTIYIPAGVEGPSALDFHFEFTTVLPFKEDLAFPPGTYLFVCYPSSPASRGEVWLSSADPLEPPRRSPNFFTDETSADLTNVLACMSTVRQIAATPPLADYTVEELLPGTTDPEEMVGFILTTAAPTYHAAGSCKFGTDDDPSAVVDERFKVRGVERLRVVDSSVMPSLTSANPTATVYMLAERAADVIKADNSQ